MSATIPRPEHPRPQMFRPAWRNLNGEWDFEFDFSRSGLDRKIYEDGVFARKITVPFCPESRLSGIGHKDFIPAAWYGRRFALSGAELSGKVLLHFGAVDYECRAFVNGKPAGTHRGGYSSFTFDITALCRPGENALAVCAEDDGRSGRQPRGKQCAGYRSAGCDYTRTTGIWQTVWLEFVGSESIASYKVIPCPNDAAAELAVRLDGDTDGMELRAEAFFRGRPAGEARAPADGGLAVLRLRLTEKHLWDAGRPNLYDLRLTLTGNGGTADRVEGYFGLRSVYVKDHAVYLNGRPVFQRLVLDQGFYPDGIYTAPSDADLARDIELSAALGFNGARLHQKAFEERFLYHADRFGYLVWGEQASWGLDISGAEGLTAFLPEWLELMARDFNHPSIIGWCPFNETWDQNGRRQDDEVLRNVYLASKAFDPTRPVIDASGNFHVVTDVYDVHDYDQDPARFYEKYGKLKKGGHYETFPDRQRFSGQPFFVSEFGGTWWNPDIAAGASKNGADAQSWGYGDAPKDEEAFCKRYAGLAGALLGSEGVCASCYTQLYDVEQEQNGLYTYDRKPKFSESGYARIKAANAAVAAIERG
ncbi:MAG: beta-galactosidase [Firmicutes bacterium]|nr:beta-galactosidase [Bacillota bacterium]